MAKYTRIQHAAHSGYGTGFGWDLEQWDVEAVSCFDGPARDKDVPNDAEYHSGYIDRNTGKQHWLFLRRAELTGPACIRCQPRAVK